MAITENLFKLVHLRITHPPPFPHIPTESFIVNITFYSLYTETRSFWISWKGGIVVVGKEIIPYEHQLVLFSPMDEFSYPIEAISVRTVGGDGVWTIDKMAGEQLWTKCLCLRKSVLF